MRQDNINKLTNTFSPIYEYDLLIKFLNQSNDGELDTYIINNNKFIDDIDFFKKKNEPYDIIPDKDLNIALENSLKQNIKNDYEPLPTIKRLKVEDLCGLKNIGNTCYFNSLIQILYSYPRFFEGLHDIYNENENNSKINLIKNLNHLFCQFSNGNQKYYNPQNIIKSIKNDKDLPINIGDQKDINEFTTIFFDNIKNEIKNLEKNYPNLLILEGKLQKEVNNKLQELQEDFLSISTHINSKEIYKGIENSLDLSRGNIKSNYYISNFPELLCIHLERSIYDEKKNCLVKNNDYFEIPFNLDLSRFNLKNINELNIIKEEIKLEEKNLISVTNEIANFINYKNSNIDIIDTMNKMVYFIQGNNEINSYDFKLKGIDNKLKDLFTDNLLILKNNYEALMKKKNYIQELIKKKYDHLKFKNLYEIYAIIIHDGSAEYGHYYNYLKKNNHWYKMSDIQVKKVQQQEVILDANGELNSTSNAYCIYYIKKDKLINQNYDFINKNLINLINTENTEFLKNYNKEQVDQIKVDFNDYTNDIMVSREIFKNKNNYLRITNINYFLYDLKFFREDLADTCMKFMETNYLKNKYKIELKVDYNIFYDIIQNKLKNKNLIIDSDFNNNDKLITVLDLFIRYYKISIYTFRSLEGFTSNNLKDYINNLVLYDNIDFKDKNKLFLNNVNIESLLIILLIVLLKINYNINKKINTNSDNVNYFVYHSLVIIMRNQKVFNGLLSQYIHLLNQIKNIFNTETEKVISNFKVYVRDLHVSNKHTVYNLNLNIQECPNISEYLNKLNYDYSMDIGFEISLLEKYTYFIINPNDIFKFDKSLIDTYKWIKNKKEIFSIDTVNLINKYEEYLESFGSLI